MNQNLKKLCALADAGTKTFLGLMSGTSLDGLDIALVEVMGTDKNTRFVLKKFTTIEYGSEYLSLIKPIFAKPNAPMAALCEANVIVAQHHANMVNATLKKWGLAATDIDVIASHGQTVFHQPNGKVKSTLQIGDGDHLAHLTQITTVSDFRQKHVAANGEGAPLVPYADFLLYGDEVQDRVLLNIGGISNFTYMPAKCNFDSVLSADSGPGNTLIDKVVQQYNLHPKGFDENGDIAASAQVVPELLSILLNDPYFTQSNTTSTGPEYFNADWLNARIRQWKQQTQAVSISPHNLVATLSHFTAQSIAVHIAKILPQNSLAYVYVSGGGAYNKKLMALLAEALPACNVLHSDELGMPACAKEAVLFAMLANQTLFSNYDIFTNSRNIPAVGLGKLSFPN